MSHSAEIYDMLEQLRQRGWTVYEHGHPDVKITNPFNPSDHVAYVSYVYKVMVSEFPSAYYMSELLARVLGYDDFDYASEMNVGYKYTLIPGEYHQQPNENSDDDGGDEYHTFRGSDIRCDLLPDEEHETFVDRILNASVLEDVVDGEGHY